MKRKRTLIWPILIICLFIAVPLFGGEESDSGAKADGKANSASEDTGNQLYSMPPSEFFEKDKVESKIDLGDVNQELLSAAIFHATNQKRKEHDKDPLEHLPRLDEASRLHAENMAEHEYVAHMARRDKELRTPVDRVREVGLNISFVAENVASHFGLQYEAGTPVVMEKRGGKTEFLESPGGEPIENQTYQSFAQSLVSQWMDSPGHRKNILSDQPQYLGAGCSISREEAMEKFYCVQLFFDRLSKRRLIP